MTFSESPVHGPRDRGGYRMQVGLISRTESAHEACTQETKGRDRSASDIGLASSPEEPQCLPAVRDQMEADVSAGPGKGLTHDDRIPWVVLDEQHIDDAGVTDAICPLRISGR
jgi:hypothetical protein